MRLKSSRTGNVAVITALLIVPLSVAAGGAVDISHAMATRWELQDVADSAALAGAESFSGGSADAAGEVAGRYVAGNWDRAKLSSMATAIDSGAQTVQVTLKARQQTAFLALIGLRTIAIGAIAKAKAQVSGPPICLLALDPEAPLSLSASGSASIDGGGCVAWTDSAAPAAMSATGAPLMPGVYCGGIGVGRNVSAKLQPGTYVIRDGALSVGGGGSLKGDGVVFVLEGGATVDLSGAGSVSLTAPTTGEFAGFVFFQRPDSNPGGSVNLGGASNLYLEGVAYFPSQTVHLGGNADTASPSPFSSFIADKLDLTGSASLRLGYDPAKTTVPIPQGLMTTFSGSVLVE